MPEVSIIVPVYNSSKYLDELFQNLLNQTLQDIEIICVDDGSQDNSAEIIKKYTGSDDRIKYIFQNNQGAGAARNTGVAVSTGKYLICIDSDDVYEKTMIEILYNKAKETDSDIVICKFKQIDIKSGKISHNLGVNNKYLPCTNVFSRKDTENIFQVTNPGTCNKLYKAEFVKRNNLKFSTTRCSNDIAFVLKAISAADKITHTDAELCTYKYMNSESISSKRTNYSYQSFIAYKEIYSFLKEKNLADELKDTYIKAVCASIVYGLSLFPVNAKHIETLKEFLSNEPFNEFSNKDLKILFNLKNLKNKYVKYRFLSTVTFGLNKTINHKKKSVGITINNFEKIIDVKN